MYIKRKLATIQKVKKVNNIPGKDLIGYASFEDIGFRVICNKDIIKEGDLVVYCEPDSILPVSNPHFSFLKERYYNKQYNGYLISCMKLAGLYSEGIVFPISILPQKVFNNYKVGTNVTGTLKIRKYEPNKDNIKRKDTFKNKFYCKLVSIANKVDKRLGRYISTKLFGSSNVMEAFPKLYAYVTDELRVQNIPNIVDYINRSNTKDTLRYTEKIDGSSTTCIYNSQTKKIYVCSRNYIIWQGTLEDVRNKTYLSVKDTKYVSILHSTDIVDVLLKLAKKYYKYRIFTIQGELIGPGIQSNKYKRDTYELYVFNVYIDKLYVDPESNTAFIDVVDNMHQLNVIPSYPFKWDDNINDISILLELSKGKSYLNDAIPREGIVIRNYADIKYLNNNLFSFKVINPDFALKYDSRG